MPLERRSTPRSGRDRAKKLASTNRNRSNGAAEERDEAASPRRAPSAANGSSEQSAQRALGSLFKAARETLRLTQDQVAALTAERTWRISRSAIGSIERGDHELGLLSLIALARVLH